MVTVKPVAEKVAGAYSSRPVVNTTPSVAFRLAAICTLTVMTWDVVKDCPVVGEVICTSGLMALRMVLGRWLDTVGFSVARPNWHCAAQSFTSRPLPRPGTVAGDSAVSGGGHAGE